MGFRWGCTDAPPSFRGLLLLSQEWRYLGVLEHLAGRIWPHRYGSSTFSLCWTFSQELVRMQMLKGMFWEAFLKRPLHCLHGHTISLQAQANLCSSKVDRIMHVSPQAWRLLLGRSLQQGSLPGGFDFP